MRSKVLIGVLAALCASASTASAITRKFSEEAEQTFRLIVPGQATWEVRNDRGTTTGTPKGVCEPGAPGLSVVDARLVANNVDKPDAFDGAFELWVNDERFVAPDAVEVTDRVLTAGPVALSGLQVTVEYRAMSSTPTLRALLTFENPTNAPIRVPFVLATNLGSDGATRLQNNTVPSENWHVTSDSDTDPGDPVVLMVSTGPEPFVTSDVAVVAGPFFTRAETFSCNTNDGRELVGTLFVPAGQTVRLLQFVRLAGSNGEGGNAGRLFDENPSLDDELMEGITREESLSIVNWGFFPSVALTGGGASWFFAGQSGTSNGLPTGGECGAIPGLGLFDAGFVPERVDAFDGGLLLFVDGAPLPLDTETFASADSEVRVGPATLSGLEVTLTHTALQSSPTLRTLVQVSNPTPAAVATQIALATNFGSDEKTVVRATSDGDEAITSADRWAITSDDLTSPTPDPVTTHVVAGPDATVLPAIGTDVFDCSGPATANGLLATYDLSVGPGETQTLLLFNQLHPVVEDATTDVAVLDGTPAPRDAILENLESTVLTSVVNWSLCRESNFADALCRVGSLQRDVFAVAPAGPVGDKLLQRVATASSATEDAEALSETTRRGMKKRLKKAQASLKAFEKVLGSKKGKAAVAEAARVRLAAKSAEIRTMLKGIGALQ